MVIESNAPMRTESSTDNWMVSEGQTFVKFDSKHRVPAYPWRTKGVKQRMGLAAHPFGEITHKALVGCCLGKNLSGAKKIARHGLNLARDISERHEYDLFVAQRRHDVGFSVGDSIDCSHPKAGSENAVGWGW